MASQRRDCIHGLRTCETCRWRGGYAIEVTQQGVPDSSTRDDVPDPLVTHLAKSTPYLAPSLGLSLSLSARPSVTFDGDDWIEVREAVRAWLAEQDARDPVQTPGQTGES